MKDSPATYFIGTVTKCLDWLYVTVPKLVNLILNIYFLFPTYFTFTSEMQLYNVEMRNKGGSRWNRTTIS